MHVGYESAFANPGRRISDAAAYRRDLRLFDLAEPLGFDSIWITEHHFSDYNMSPDPVQFLTYMASRTDRIRLGTGVVVLPWHDPIRVAEQISLLDHFSRGRTIFGVGRGAAHHEFDGFRVDIDTSRERFLESAELVLNALETGVAQLHGEFIEQPSREIRPAPYASFKGRRYVGSMSPESFEGVAKLGLGLKLVVQKSWDVVAAEVSEYAEIYRAHHHADPPPPIATVLVFVDHDAGRAEELANKWLGAYFQTTVDHYGFNRKYEGPGDFYKKASEHLAAVGSEAMTANFVKLCPHGTPEQVYDHIAMIHRRLGVDAVVCQFLYAGMDESEGERNLRLFAAEVLPELKRLGSGLPFDTELPIPR